MNSLEKRILKQLKKLKIYYDLSIFDNLMFDSYSIILLNDNFKLCMLFSLEKLLFKEIPILL